MRQFFSHAVRQSNRYPLSTCTHIHHVYPSAPFNGREGPPPHHLQTHTAVDWSSCNTLYTPHNTTLFKHTQPSALAVSYSSQHPRQSPGRNIDCRSRKKQYPLSKQRAVAVRSASTACVSHSTETETGYSHLWENRARKHSADFGYNWAVSPQRMRTSITCTRPGSATSPVPRPAPAGLAAVRPLPPVFGRLRAAARVLGAPRVMAGAVALSVKRPGSTAHQALLFLLSLRRRYVDFKLCPDGNQFARTNSAPIV